MGARSRTRTALTCKFRQAATPSRHRAWCTTEESSLVARAYQARLPTRVIVRWSASRALIPTSRLIRSGLLTELGGWCAPLDSNQD